MHDKLISLTKTSKKALEAINQKLLESTLSIQVGKIEEDTTGITCSDGTPTRKKHHQRNSKMHSLIHLP